MQEKGGRGLIDSGNKAELRNSYLPKWLSEICKFLHFGKQEGHCAPCLLHSDHARPPARLPGGDVTQSWSASPFPQMLSQEEGAGVWRKV